MKKGASLIWAVVVATALLFIAVTTASFVIKESQMSIRMDDSSRAYAAAESGIEWGKYCVENLTECDSSYTSPTFNVGGSQYSVKVTVTASETKIESLGTSNGVNRKLEHVITPNNALDIASNPITNNFTVAGSYVQQFDYWTNGAPGSAKIGLGNSTGSKAIYLEHIGNDFFLSANNSVSVRSSNNNSQNKKITIDSAKISEPDNKYALQVRIEYFKDLSVKMTISERNFGVGSSFSCISPTLVIDLRGFGISTNELTKFYYSATPTPAPLTIGDGSAYVISKDVNTESYFDNMATKGIAGPMSYTLTYIAGPNGSVAGTSSQTVTSGNSGSAVTAVPSSGYHFVNWSDSSTQNPRTDMSVSGNITVTANFAANTGATYITLTEKTGCDCGRGCGTWTLATDQTGTFNLDIYRWNGSSFVLQETVSNVSNGYVGSFTSYGSGGDPNHHYVEEYGKGYVKINTLQSNTLDTKLFVNDDWC